MIEYKGLTDKNKLIDTMIAHDRLGMPRQVIEEVIFPKMERCIEIWYNKGLAGYVMIFNTNGEKSLHGYKLIKGHFVGAVKIAKEFVSRYPDLFISTHASRDNVVRLAKILGFTETYRGQEIVKLEKNVYASIAA
jgi:hypothetical protein